MFSTELSINLPSVANPSDSLLTVEGNLIWLDADGEISLSTTITDNIVDLVCPFGEWAIVGF
jgi:hypothetical protein